MNMKKYRKKGGNNPKYFEVIEGASVTSKLGDLHRQRKEHLEKKRFHHNAIYNISMEINSILDGLE